MFNDYNGDHILRSRSESSNSVNIRDIFRIQGMLKMFIFGGMGAVFGANQPIRRFKNSLESR